ncbi:Fas associated factor 1, partial [Operophtera brumata]
MKRYVACRSADSRYQDWEGRAPHRVQPSAAWGSSATRCCGSRRPTKSCWTTKRLTATYTLNVKYDEKDYTLQFPGTKTVREVKNDIYSLTDIPARHQVTIYTLHVKHETDYTVQFPGTKTVREVKNDIYSLTDIPARHQVTIYTLHVKHETDYTVQFPGTKTVREVKNDIYSLTDIPARHQVWTGWPTVQGLDDTVLAMVGLDSPQHKLTIIIESSDSENSSAEETEEQPDAFIAEDDMFDETLGCVEFAQRFRARYGPNTPHFFEGTLQDAVMESCHKPAQEVSVVIPRQAWSRAALPRALRTQHAALRGHSAGRRHGVPVTSPPRNESCLEYTYTTSNQSCPTCSAHNFSAVTWCCRHWRLTSLLSSIASVLGPVASMTIRSIPVDRLPALVIIMQVRSNTELYSAWDRFAHQRAEDAKVERERDARQQVKREQDEAYQRSLEVDRAKEEVKQQILKEKNQEIERAAVPPEPEEDAKDVARIRVRLPPPQDANLERRFHPTNTLQ